MPPLLHTSARALEFDSLREMLRAYAYSPLGEAKIAALAPSGDHDWIERQQQLTAEIREYLRVGARFEFSGLLDPTALVEKAHIEGAALDTAELGDIILVVDRADEWRHIAQEPPSQMKVEFTAVSELSSTLGDFADLLRFFHNKILPDGTFDDRASPELARIRREIERQRRLIQESLRAYLRRLAEGGTVQDELITIRGERFVVPVRIEQKRRVQGVVHGASSSGQTVFVEPMETIEQNNELVRMLEEEQAEIHRILLEMTARIRQQAAAILAATAVLAELELQFAKARFANDYECTRPEGAPPLAGFAKGGGVWETKSKSPPLATEAKGRAPTGIMLRNARHPVLDRTLKGRGASIVPITVELEPPNHQLIVSGPNTGGKTVALKTIGLLVLMAQSGIPVPAEGAELPVFDAVLADIGDYQSIEQNLSTFSAHVTNIDFISRTATQQSLVLLDELGSATDPAEGAALAVAIAEHFRQVGAISIISTHHTSLKVYATNTPGVFNAAVGFDEATLQPTYELKLGVPGASAGINIAQRLGLNPSIISAARASLGSQAQDIAQFLDRLHAELRQAEQERHRLQQREQELARERQRLEAEGLKEQRQRVREMEKKLDAVFRDFEYHARETVNAIQDRAQALKLSKDAERRISRLRREFKDQFDAAVVAHTTGADRDDPNARPGEVKHVSEGDTVKLKSLGRNAVVKRRVDDQTFEVEMGAMKMKVGRDDIAEVVVRGSDSPLSAARAKGISVSVADSSAAPTEINVIGKNVDEATARVEKFLDRAFLAGLTRVRIVHGSGMGTLRKALRQYLQNHPQVAAISEPPQNEGGAGATVVELRV